MEKLAFCSDAVFLKCYFVYTHILVADNKGNNAAKKAYWSDDPRHDDREGAGAGLLGWEEGETFTVNGVGRLVDRINVSLAENGWNDVVNNDGTCEGETLVDMFASRAVGLSVTERTGASLV